MREIIRLARNHGSMVVHDFAYADLGFDGYKPPSILQVPGAKEVAVEIFSMSKSYNMAGWRVGFCLGNPKMIAALARIKSYLDYGVFQPIQIASIIALRECEEDTDKICAMYQKRRDVLVDGLNAPAGPWKSRKGSMFVWAPIPERYRIHRLAGILEAAAGEGAGRRFAGHRVRSAGRRLRAVRADRKRSTDEAGAAFYQAVSEAVRYFLFTTTLVMASALAEAADHPRRSLPAVLWAAQVAVPPGTNTAPASQTVTPPETQPTIPGLPAGVQVTAPAAAPDAAQGAPRAETPVGGGPPPPPGASPIGPRPGGAPIRQLPPGLPMGAVPGATGTGVKPRVPPTTGAQPAGVQPPGVPVPDAQPSPGVQPPGVTPSGEADAPPIVPKLVSCEVTFTEGRIEISAEGGEFPIPAVLKPAGCPASIGISVPWLAVAEALRLELAVEPNRTPSTREAVVLIAGRSFFIRQAAQPQPALAAAPSRLVFAVNVKGESGTKRLTAWGEAASANFVARSRHPWLLVTPKTNTDGRRAYEISIKPGAALPPGRHDSAIELFEAGSPNRSLVIPVVVEVEGRFH